MTTNWEKKTLGEQAAEKLANDGYMSLYTRHGAAQIIDTLHAQQPCAGCEKLREKISHFADSLRRVGWPREADKLDEILAQPCQKPQEDSNSQAVEAAIDILDGNKEPIDWRKGGHELLRKLCEHLEVCSNPPQPQASAGSEEWTVEDKFGCWQIWSAKGCEGDHLLEVAAKSLCQSHNASLRHQSAPAADGKIDQTLPDSLDLRNGGQRCDLITGPCACGAWHRLEEMPWRLQNQLRQSAPVEAWRDLDVTRPVESDGDEYGRILCRWSDEEIRTWPVSHFTKNEPTRVTHWAPLPKFGPERKT